MMNLSLQININQLKYGYHNCILLWFCRISPDRTAYYSGRGLKHLIRLPAVKRQWMEVVTRTNPSSGNSDKWNCRGAVFYGQEGANQ